MADSVEIIGIKELRAAIKRNPQKVLTEARNFLTRGLASYKAGIIRSPWKMGGTGGGAPVKTGNLRDTHQTNIKGLIGTIGPTAKYASYVHGIKGFPRKRSYQLRPWLDYVRETKDRDVRDLYIGMLKNIVADLAK